MASGLVDSNVLIDLLRGYVPAVGWIAQQDTLAITQIVYLELLDGAQDRRGEQKALSLLSAFEIVDLAASDYAWAIERMLMFHLSHQVDWQDCLIAAPAARLQLPLYTHNLKHFAPLLGDLARKPY
jgi:predicted nucleic acid-binding protein